MILIHLCCRIWILWEIQNSKHSSQSFITISCHPFPIISHTSTYISSQPRAAGAHQHPATYQHTTHLHSLTPRAAGAVAKLFTPSFWFGVCFQFPVSSFQFPVSSFQFPVSSFQFPVSWMNVWMYGMYECMSVWYFQFPVCIPVSRYFMSDDSHLEPSARSKTQDRAGRRSQSQADTVKKQYSSV